jgi:hypothetical protein
MDGSQDFNRKWGEYATGFGSPSGEYSWLAIWRLNLCLRHASLATILMNKYPADGACRHT